MRKAKATTGPLKKIAAGFGVLIVGLAVAQVIQSSSVADKSGQIRILENEVADLKEMQDRLELKTAEEQTIASVESRVGSLGLVHSDHIEYIAAAAPVVAKR